MSFEVYAGAKPGRPRLLALTTGGLLALTLALAWWQVRDTRALTPPQRIGDTPLSVRLPRGWQPDPANPQRFLLPVADRGRRTLFEFERRIEFTFARLPSFESPRELLARPVFGGVVETSRAEHAFIGPYDALQRYESVPTRIGRAQVRRDTVTRVTCLPRGHLLRVVYEPLVELRPADLEILDEVCRSLRVDDPSLNRPRNEYLEQAGLVLPLDPAWLVVGTDFAEVPGVFLGGLINSSPEWAIAVLRTWLAPDRTPRDLLADFAAQEWLQWETADLIRDSRRSDGAAVAHIRHPGFGRLGPSIPSAWVVATSPAEAAILFVYTGPDYAEAVDEIAGRLVAEMRLRAIDGIPAPDAAVAAGRELSADLRKRGPAPRWGRESLETTYRRENRDEIVTTRRAAVQRDPTRGYEGLQWRRVGPGHEERISWTLDGMAAAYRWQADFYYGQLPVRVIEQRADPTAEVVRQVFVEQRREQRWSFRPGDLFVPPPAESIIKGWVARGDAPAAALMVVSTPLGPGVHSVLLRRLAPDGPYPRVLVQQDFWPFGAIEAFDDARAETHGEVYPTATYIRIR